MASGTTGPGGVFGFATPGDAASEALFVRVEAPGFNAREVRLDGRTLTLADVAAVARDGAVVALDPVDSHPTFTFTAPTPPEQRPPAAPSAPYLATILHGLREVHDLDDTDIVERVGQSPGVRPNWSPAAMHQLLDTPLSEISST